MIRERKDFNKLVRLCWVELHLRNQKLNLPQHTANLLFEIVADQVRHQELLLPVNVQLR